MPSMKLEHAGALARSKLGDAKGRHFWRALEELADDPGFKRELAQVLPQFSAFAEMDRRRFLQLLGASLAFGGLAACSGPPSEHIVPWVTPPPDVTPDMPQFYATTLAYAGDVIGVLVASHMGRPTKIEGNPMHPASLGATGPLPQAAVLEVWDPDRSQVPLYRGEAASWDAFATDLKSWPASFAHDGNGLHVLSDRITSPTLRVQRDRWLQQFPHLHWHEYAPLAPQSTQQGAWLAFGQRVTPRYNIDQADVILSLEADFLESMPGRVAHARAFADRRNPSSEPGMNRLYVVESTPSLAGSMADHRWVLESSSVALFALELARALDVDAPASIASGLPEQRLRALLSDLQAHRGRSLIMAGESQPPQVHALVHRLNEKLGNVGRTVDYVALPDDTGTRHTLDELCQAITSNQVQRLVVLDCNVVYNAPADLQLPALLKKIPHVIHWGLYADETAQFAQWHLPASHALESWSDAQTDNGVASIVQPLIDPLYQGRSIHEFVAMLMGASAQSGLAIVQAHWREQNPSMSWPESVRAGVIAGDGHPVDVSSSANDMDGWSPQPLPFGALEVVFRPDATVWDGRYANNGWLQELPKPHTQLTWGNAALISTQLAGEQDLANGDVIVLEHEGRSIEAPVWITPGQAARSITLHLGYGRTHAGRVGNNLGFNAYRLRTTHQPWIARGVSLRKAGRSVQLVSTQQHFDMESPEPVRSVTLATLSPSPSGRGVGVRVRSERDVNDSQGIDHPASPVNSPPAPLPDGEGSTPVTLYPDQPQGDYAWGMTVDLNTCIGCKGCTIACQAENNIPVVGADQVLREREMHWIRVDRYYSGPAENPVVHHQPVPCMQCEHAPCEVVCPVGATVHDDEGLNLQVYNRCIGTRFCSNNCPYKVRRFNFLQFNDVTTETLKAQRNPQVTVRNRGVMEKCTYCIQRIENAHIAADREQREIKDGEVVTACQAACPTQAITFGNLRDPNSEVSRLKKSPRNYDLLEELNTRPRTSYLAHVRNRHPDLENDT